MCVAPVSERKGQVKDADKAVAEREVPEGTAGANESGVEPGGVQCAGARATWTWTGRALVKKSASGELAVSGNP